MSKTLKAVASLRNASSNVYHVSPNCNEGHYEMWKEQLKTLSLWPVEKGIYFYDIRRLQQALRTLTTPKQVEDCGCKNFTPSLPEDLQRIVWRAIA